MIENRAAPRHKVLKRGSIRFSGGGSIDCTVRNLSSNGAGLDVVSPIGLDVREPSTFAPRSGPSETTVQQ